MGITAEGPEEGVAGGWSGPVLAVSARVAAGEGRSNTQEAWPGQRHLLAERMCFYRPAVKFRGPAGSVSSHQRWRWAVLGRPGELLGFEGAQEPCEGTTATACGSDPLGGSPWFLED